MTSDLGQTRDGVVTYTALQAPTCHKHFTFQWCGTLLEIQTPLFEA